MLIRRSKRMGFAHRMNSLLAIHTGVKMIIPDPMCRRCSRQGIKTKVCSRCRVEDDAMIVKCQFCKTKFDPGFGRYRTRTCDNPECQKALAKKKRKNALRLKREYNENKKRHRAKLRKARKEGRGSKYPICNSCGNPITDGVNRFNHPECLNSHSDVGNECKPRSDGDWLYA